MQNDNRETEIEVNKMSELNEYQERLIRIGEDRVKTQKTEKNKVPTVEELTKDLAGIQKMLNAIDETKKYLLGNPSKPIYDLAVFMHKSYLGFARKYNWKVQYNTDTIFSDLPFSNQKIMLELALMIYSYFEIGE